MPFSQQTYTGQGIVQPTERSRVGELLGAGIAGLGAGIGEGIKKFRQDKEEAKELRANLKLFRKTIPEENREAFDATIEAGSLADLKGLKRGILEMGALELQELKKQEAKEALTAKKFARQTMEEEGKMYSDMLQAFQPQQVQRDFGPEITAAEKRLMQAEQAGFRPEFKFSGGEAGEFRAGAFSTQPQADYTGATPRTQDLPDQFLPTFIPFARRRETVMPEMSISNALKAAQSLPSPSDVNYAPQVDSQPPQRPSTPMGPEPALEPSPEVQQAARDLDILRIQAAEGDTRLETSKEVMKRVSENIPELAEKYPTQAKNLYEMLYAKQDKLTPSDQISLMKLEREIGASTVTGYGVAPSPEIAKDFREVLISATEAQTGIKRLLEINAMDSPWASIDLRSEAQVLQGALQGALRREIVGPGAVTESEQQLLKSIIRDPTKFWSLSSSNKTALETLLKKVERGLAKNAALISWQQPSGMQSGQAQGPMGKTFTYGMSGQLESR
jgi:hypothetical protein